METDGQISPASQEAIESAEKLYNAIQVAFPQAVRDFESKWATWHTVCHSQTSPSRIQTCLQTDEFQPLKRLGPKLIPLVVFKLARDPDQNCCGVFLYNTLENDPDYYVNLDETRISKKSLYRYGRQIVELNYQRNKIVEERVKAWKDYCWSNQLHSTTAVFTLCEEYFDLLEMGPSIIAHLMVEYCHDQGGYWYELLHEIVHGRKMGAYMVQKPVLFEECRQFFNEGEHDQAPKYIPTPVDQYIYTGEIGD